MKLLLIGMGPGIGLALARRFGREGFEILMVARNEQKLKDFEAQLAAENIRAKGYPVDIAAEDSYIRMLEKLAAEHSDIEVLHYNPSAFNPALPSQISLPVFLNDFKINVMGALSAAQAVFPHMKSRGRGTLFFTGGGTALKAPPAMASLGIGKAGLRSLVFSLAQECKPLGIHVATLTICGAVEPGTRFDPDLIAGEFWRIYAQPKEQWETEVVLQ
ncbi:MAG: SDR family NAD(P)-dependent oxidoreductase [Saprospiraceae bacterium]|nr:SDR family NAD(P)-dependent oxidoreductase [Saprospiraceae bacterium]